MTVRRIAGSSIAIFLAVLSGCRGGDQTPADVTIQPGEYEAAFAAARDVLRECDFRIEREDAYSGVITTQPKSTAGWATPWDREQRSAWQETEDLLNRQTRVVRVEFAPAGEGPAAVGDLRETARTSPVRLRVLASLSRRQRPGWRLETGAIRASTRASDPDRASRGMEPEHDVAVAEDRELATYLREIIRERVSPKNQ